MAFAELKQRLVHLHKKYESRLEVFFFIGGFVFDAWMVSKPDELFAILQQAAYLFVIAALIHYELLFRLHKWRPEGRMEKLWKFRNLLLHFLLGTLLNLYSLFYIKSASLLNSLIFLALMIGIILANELPAVKKANVSFKVALYAICLFSFISILYPIILGFVGWTPFGLSLATTLGIFYLQLKLLLRKLPDQRILFRALIVPGFSVLLVFGFFYYMSWIPPVPLSVKEQGIYHFLEKNEGEFLLSTEKVWWKFWQSGDSDFKAEPGDKLYFYAQIYSPARFKDEVYIHWYWVNAKGNWEPMDRIVLKIVGGREEGYRGYTVKSNYVPGRWRVDIETAGGQEISRLYFHITAVEKNEGRSFQIIRR
jgi:hypothetical protein